MSDKHELRKLDVWIGEHLYGLRTGVDWNPEFELISESLPWFSSNHGAAMRLLEKLAKERVLHIVIYFTGQWRVQCGIPKKPFLVDEGGTTLPEAICRFAKAVWPYRPNLFTE